MVGVNFLSFCTIISDRFRDRLQISILIVSEFQRINYLLFQLKYGFLMILGGIEFNSLKFA